MYVVDPKLRVTSTKASHPVTFILFKNVTIHDIIVAILTLLFFSYALLLRVLLSYSLLRSNYDLNSNKNSFRCTNKTRHPTLSY